MIYELGYILTIIGLIGYTLIYPLYDKSIIYLLITLEIMLLGIAIIFISISIYFNDLFALNYALYILVLAGTEAAVGLGLFITYYQIRNNL